MVSNPGSGRMAARVTYNADPAAWMESAAHAAYLTEATNVTRERPKRSNSSAMATLRSGMVGRL